MAFPIGLGGSGIITGRGSGWATTAVEKATSDLLIGPDWAMNIEICDSLNSLTLQAKDVVKVLKKRLLHKNAGVQMLALTLLETMIKNCSDNVHCVVAETVLPDLVKIVKTQSDLRVREKILVLVMSWQEAFGGPGGRFPQYFGAFDDLRRFGVQFPKRSSDASPIFTPPAKQPQVITSFSSRRLDETMAADSGRLSFSTLDSMRDAMELLSEMLQALNHNDRQGAREELITDLVDCCRSNQKKLVQMLTTTVDEGLLCCGIELNESVQGLLAKYDAILSGTYVATDEASSDKLSSATVAPAIVAPVVPVVENDEDEFDVLARRHGKGTCAGEDGESGQLPLVPVDISVDASASTSTALVISDVPAPEPARTKEQDLIQLLSMSLTMTTVEQPPAQAPEQSDNLHGGPSGYVASWAASPQPQMAPVAEARAFRNEYPPPPWASTPGYFVGQGSRQSMGIYGRGTGEGYNGQGNVVKEQSEKPFIPTHRLFEELNVFGNASHKVAGSGNGIVGPK